MGCINVATSNDGKYFLARNTTYDDNEKEILNASIEELQDRIAACKNFYQVFKEELDNKVQKTTSE